MKKNAFLILFFLGGGLVFSGNCAHPGMPVHGILLTDTKVGQSSTSLQKHKKSGRACAFSVLGLVAIGDASVGAASRAGGLEKVAGLHREGKSFLGIYAESCTVAHGE